MLGIILFTLIATNDPAPSCLDKLVIFSNESTYQVKVEKRLLFVNAWIERSILQFALKTKDEHGLRIPEFRGADQFNKMIRHFDGKFNKILGRWCSDNVCVHLFGENFKVKLRSNLDDFNLAISKGLSPIEAAKSTWTGKQAALHGYTEVEIVSMSEINTSPKVYDDVEVLFSKPR